MHDEYNMRAETVGPGMEPIRGCSSPGGVLVDDVKGTTTRMGAISRRRVSAVAIIRRVIVVVVVEAATS